jgi:hypothetical protein
MVPFNEAHEDVPVTIANLRARGRLFDCRCSLPLVPGDVGDHGVDGVIHPAATPLTVADKFRARTEN